MCHRNFGCVFEAYATLICTCLYFLPGYCLVEKKGNFYLTSAIHPPLMVFKSISMKVYDCCRDSIPIMNMQLKDELNVNEFTESFEIGNEAKSSSQVGPTNLYECRFMCFW